MHYRNGREAKNGDRIVQLGMSDGKLIGIGVLDDLAAILAEKGLDKRPGRSRNRNGEVFVP